MTRTEHRKILHHSLEYLLMNKGKLEILGTGYTSPGAWLVAILIAVWVKRTSGRFFFVMPELLQVDPFR